MKTRLNVDKRFRKLHAVKRHKHHIMIHHIHRKHHISYRTLFYMKEYGTRSHAARTIIKESVKILFLASIISSFGGMGIESVKEKFILLLPLLIMIPAFNDMIGDFGTVISSKFTSMIYTGKVSLRKGITSSKAFRKLAMNVFVVAFIASVYTGLASYALAYMQGFAFNSAMLAKVVGISIICTMVLVGVIFAVSVISGIYVYRRKEDPNNFLIPITTSVADFASMLLFSLLVVRLF